MSNIIKHRRGDTFTLACTAYLDDAEETPRPLADVTIRSQVRHASDGTRYDLTVQVVDAAAGTYLITAPAVDTEEWRVGPWNCDIEYEEGGVVNSTETFVVQVEKDVTHDD
ncbi:hypothetical protein [Tropicimonas sp. IMCC34011]|uniref:hypothetical protein n=1 Tax=Tropicimonas sp. IMCC34011 TaxID=2248759 RepID=UPI000E27002A|nr:hypothetical protein [Tropicimonas sp. IMCC34011]